jgi:hypothetical protein
MSGWSVNHSGWSVSMDGKETIMIGATMPLTMIITEKTPMDMFSQGMVSRQRLHRRRTKSMTNIDYCSAAVGNNPDPLSPAPHRKVRGFYFVAEKVSTNSSPGEQYRSNDGAIKGGCRAVANSA